MIRHGFPKLPAFVVVFMMFSVTNTPAQTPKPPLTEDDIQLRLKAKLDNATITSQLDSRGIAFTADDAAISRLKQAGASDAVLEAVRKAKVTKAPAAGALNYDDVLRLLLKETDEAEILKQLQKSPIAFVLDVNQEAELKKAGASDKLLAALKAPRASAGQPGNDITALALILDCSGSMSELTKDKESKMIAAKRVVTQLMQNVPDGVQFLFMIYGYDLKLGCDAIKIVRPLGPLDDNAKAELKSFVTTLQPTGDTPIAKSLRMAGAELAKVKGKSQIIVITDGMETCGGKPDEEAAMLVANGTVQNVHVVGLNLDDPQERAGVQQIAKAGKGKFSDARSADELTKALEDVVAFKVEEPAINSQKSSVSGIKVTPLTLKDFPKIKEVHLTKPGQLFTNEQKGAADNNTIVVSPGVYDLVYVPEQGQNIVIAEKLTVKENEVVTVTTNKVVAGIRVVDPKLGIAVQRISANLPGQIFTGVQQATDAFDKVMLVAGGKTYDIVLTPPTGQPVAIAKNIKPKAGELTVVGGN
jgi:Mg-chelatase subunit ChlD